MALHRLNITTMKRNLKLASTTHPRSMSRTEPVSLSRSPLRHSRVSMAARLISSRRTQSPDLIAFTRLPYDKNARVVHSPDRITIFELAESGDADDVPPLEDMSELIQQVDALRELRQTQQDRKFVQAIGEFQRDPKTAMTKYGNNPEVQEFFQDFCGLMGDHFNKLGDKVPGGGTSGSSIPQKTSAPGPVQTRTQRGGADLAVHSSTDPHQPTAQDEAKMQDILADPEIRDILGYQLHMGKMETVTFILLEILYQLNADVIFADTTIEEDSESGNVTNAHGKLTTYTAAPEADGSLNSTEALSQLRKETNTLTTATENVPTAGDLQNVNQILDDIIDVIEINPSTINNDSNF
ncbi:hypothetical protein MAR_018033 [Mya arenaria]|uniref:Uncharacterized protein n=1 Tax=Mya arenaria TaxID=6604 RepID=A0ABY7EDH1_MYAAR|nr:hypothetical protein MAR_018033 [Mya arenaria]